MKKNTIIAIGIISITTLQIVALINKIDGQIYITVVTALTGLLGYLIGKKNP